MSKPALFEHHQRLVPHGLCFGNATLVYTIAAFEYGSVKKNGKGSKLKMVNLTKIKENQNLLLNLKSLGKGKQLKIVMSNQRD